MKKTKRVVLLLVVCCIFSVFFKNYINANASEKNKPETVGYVFIGDSRTVGMNNVIHFEDEEDYFMVAKSGMGYKWFTSTGYKQLKKIRNDNEYDRWVYIFNLGINDLDNVDKYVELIEELSNEATVYYISINPTMNRKKVIDCSDIEKFNSLIAVKSDNYIDCYHYLKDTGYYATDGIHYDNETYQKIYDFVTTSIKLNEYISANVDDASKLLSYMIAQ